MKIASGFSLPTILKVIGEKVAQASTEGGFLGFGGERVSEGERQFLSKLDAALGHSAV